MALLAVEDALARILDGASALEAEPTPLRQAANRTLALDVAALTDNPPFDASAMDGYAVRAEDALAGATLSQVGVSAAGRPFNGTLGSNQAVRIFTGAAVPNGADAIVIQEDTSADGNNISIREAASVGDNIRARGQDFKNGEVLIPRGRQLNARDILLAASCGHPTVPTVRRPVVAILSTGDELVAPGTPLSPGQIPASNSFGLAAMVEAAGGEARVLETAHDTLDSLKHAIAQAADADILLTIGGASVGDHDLVRPALEAAGAKLDFYKIAMRPGKPLFFGKRESSGRQQRCLGLPGNPVSAHICARVFLVPLIGALLGRQTPFEAIDAKLGAALPKNGPREHYMRGRLDMSVAPPRATAFSSQDSGRVVGLQQADCLIVVQADAPPLPEGTNVRVLKFDF